MLRLMLSYFYLKLKACATSAYTHLGVFVSQVKGELQVGEEMVRELGVHIQDLHQIFSGDDVQVAVAQGPDICVRLPGFGVKVNHLPEDVVLSWFGNKRVCILGEVEWFVNKNACCLCSYFGSLWAKVGV